MPRRRLGAGIDLLKAYGNVVEAFDLSPADLCAKISLCDALIVRSATKARAAAARALLDQRGRRRGAHAARGGRRRGRGRATRCAAALRAPGARGAPSSSRAARGRCAAAAPRQVSKEVFAAGAGRLKVVGRAGVGIDNVDLGAATEAGVLVVNAPTANTVAAAEHGIALLCALSRFVPQADLSMKAGKWERAKYTGVSLVGKTLAVMGFGKARAGQRRMRIASPCFSVHTPGR